MSALETYEALYKTSVQGRLLLIPTMDYKSKFEGETKKQTLKYERGSRRKATAGRGSVLYMNVRQAFVI